MKACFAFFSIVVAAWSLPSQATSLSGFAVTDLTQISGVAFNVPGKTFGRRAEPKRMTLGCLSCTGVEAIDISVNKSTDGTEGRYRAGTTTVATIERQCQAREPSCSIEAVAINGAVGWVSRTRAGTVAISTSILFKNGDLLQIRSIASTIDLAYANGQAVRSQIAPAIIGRN
jgi:hypothetical protein